MVAGQSTALRLRRIAKELENLSGGDDLRNELLQIADDLERGNDDARWERLKYCLDKLVQLAPSITIILNKLI